MAWVWPKELSENEKKAMRPRGRRVRLENEPISSLVAQVQESEATGVQQSLRLTENPSRYLAPFGTNDTPHMSTKIIGGKYVPVLERYSPTNMDGADGQISIRRLNDITDKPNHIPQELLRKGAKKYYSSQQEPQEDPLGPSSHGKPTHMGRYRPDSKSLERGRLPPLEHNKYKNKKSTVFEPEVGANERSAYLMSETEYMDMYKADQKRPQSEDQNGYQGQGQYQNTNGGERANSDYVTGNNRYDSPGNNYKNSSLNAGTPQTISDKRNKLLSKYFWGQRPGAFPTHRILFSPEEEGLLQDVVASEIEGFSRHRIDAIKMDAIIADRDVNNTCAASTLEKIFKEHGLRLDTDTLRLLEARFLDSSQPGWVFYSDLIKFIKDLLPKRSRPYETENGYRKDALSPLDDLNALQHKPLGMTLRVAKKELEEAGNFIDLAKIRSDLKFRDTPARGRLSEQQICDVLYANKVLLTQNTIKDLLNLKRKTMSVDGQYDYEAFCDVLEMIQPENTGLKLFHSKRPLEHARPTLQPGESWPMKTHTERNGYHEGYERPRDAPPRGNWQRDDYRGYDDGYDRGYGGDQYTDRRRQQSPYRGQPSYRDREEDRSPRGRPYMPRNNPLNYSPRRDTEEEILRVDAQLRELQAKNEDLIKQAEQENSQLFLAIEDLSKDLYTIDESRHRSSGKVHVQELLDAAERRRVPLSRRFLENIAEGCANQKNMVDISLFMERLINNANHL